MRSSRNRKILNERVSGVVTDQKMRSSLNYELDLCFIESVVTDQKMGSSRNEAHLTYYSLSCCNRLENAVNPQQNAGKTSLYSIFISLIRLFVDFTFQFQYIFLGHRAIRSATFLVLGVSDPTVSSNFSFFAFSNFPATFDVKLL